ncbi:unnamed protein product, partial [Urochloa humidicola]
SCGQALHGLRWTWAEVAGEEQRGGGSGRRGGGGVHLPHKARRRDLAPTPRWSWLAPVQRLGSGGGREEEGGGARVRSGAGAPPSTTAGGRRAGRAGDLRRPAGPATAPADGSIRPHPGRATSSSCSGPARATRARSSSGAASSSLGRRSSRGIGGGRVDPRPNRPAARLPRPLTTSATSSTPQASVAAAPSRR